MLAKDINPAPLARNRTATWIVPCVLTGIVLLTTILPLSGIVRPLFIQFPATRAFREISRTLGNPLVYALTAGLIATAMGIWLALAAGREKWLRQSYAACQGSLWFYRCLLRSTRLVSSSSGQWGLLGLDPLLRSRLTVGIASRPYDFFPSRRFSAMRSFGSSPPSQCLVGAVHGLSLLLYLRRVLGPLMLFRRGHLLCRRRA